MSLTQDIKAEAISLGFDLVGITDASPISDGHVKLLAEWLDGGYAGEMNYLRRNLDKRIDPGKLLPRAQSIIIVGLNYKPAQHDAQQNRDATVGRVAAYAQYEDYHGFIRRRLTRLIEHIRQQTGPDARFKTCVDAEPIAERALAARAGLGFIGKSHILINPEIGPQILLGEIVTTVRLDADEPITETRTNDALCRAKGHVAERQQQSLDSRPSASSGQALRGNDSKDTQKDIINTGANKPASGGCSGCDMCVRACPTGALRPDGRFDANRCISYLTIEYKGQIAAGAAKNIGDRVFGCDECILVCPYQQKAPACKNREFKFYPDRARLDLGALLNLTQPDFDAQFADSPIRRTGLERLKRNACICLTNTSQNRLL